jgi:UDP-glucose:(glucosyl)LPS alpha-1,2-glucosyltransferase
MDGSRTAAERLALLDNAAAVICVSDFIRRCFLDGIDTPRGALVHVLHTGVAASPDFPTAKAPKIVFVGRMVPDKGVLELVEALALVLPRYPDWSADILGAHWFGTSRRLSPYEKQVAHTAARCERIRLGGFQPHEQVIATLRRASIAVVPSRWDDPFPRTALEALANGCALVCSSRGGLPEIGGARAVFLQNVSTERIVGALDALISDDAARTVQQQRGWVGFPFEIGRTTQQLDQLRAALMGIT